jgi:hypothetical protein
VCWHSLNMIFQNVGIDWRHPSIGFNRLFFVSGNTCKKYFLKVGIKNIYVSPHFVFVLSVTQFVSASPLKLLNRISWNLVDSKDTICSCAYYQEILIVWILWELCPFELRIFTKFTTEAAFQRNSSETTEQNFMKLGR